MSEIRIDLQYCLTLKADVDTTTSSLRDNVRNDNGIASDPRIDDRLRSFGKRWDERRDELADSLGNVSQALQAIHDSFRETDETLAAELGD